MKLLLQKLLREPLLHFLLAGFIVFLILGRSGAYSDPESRVITVDEDRVSQLVASFSAIWKRAPTPKEIDSLIRDYIREEVYYREAKKLGLDINDPIIRRRLRAKMEELASAAAESADPDDAALQQLIESNPAKYAIGGKLSFRQIWLGREGDAAAALAQLKEGGDPAKIGGTISLPAQMRAATPEEIDREFGEGFAEKLAEFPDGQWTGPLSSGFGEHLACVESRTDGRVPIVDEIRQRLENDWRAASISKRKDRAYQALLDGYDIRIEKPE